MILVIFMIFPAAGNKKKQFNYNEKKMVQIWKGYCPNRIVRKKKIVLQESGLYCRDLGLDNLNCITGLV